MTQFSNNQSQKRKIGVFIDGANLWHCQKRNGWRIDFYKLKKYLSQRGEIKGLYYFTPEIRHLKKILAVLDKLGYTIIKKPLKKIKLRTDSKTKKFKTKGNLDMEMGLMMVAQTEFYDEFIIMTGDSDFEIVVESLKKKGKNVIVISNRDSLSREMRKASNSVVYLHKIKKEIKYKIKNPPKRALS